jgi:hypothetical protein
MEWRLSHARSTFTGNAKHCSHRDIARTNQISMQVYGWSGLILTLSKPACLNTENDAEEGREGGIRSISLQEFAAVLVFPISTGIAQQAPCASSNATASA